VDHHRLIRHAYGAQAGYMRMVDPAYAAWDQVWRDIGEVLHIGTGVLAVSGSDAGWLGEDIDFLYDFIHSGDPAKRAYCNSTYRDGQMATGRDRTSGDYNTFGAERDLARHHVDAVVEIGRERTRCGAGDAVAIASRDLRNVGKHRVGGLAWRGVRQRHLKRVGRQIVDAFNRSLRKGVEDRYGCH
jgi:hypothetical protein